MNKCTKCGDEHPLLMPCRYETGGSISEWLCYKCLTGTNFCISCGAHTENKTRVCDDCVRDREDEYDRLDDDSFIFSEE